MELNLNKIKVVLVDDDYNFTFALKTLLDTKGLKIESFLNPEEALDFLKSNRVDMILLDYKMPQMTGEQFLIKLREFDKSTVVFLETAFSEEKPELEMLESLNIQGYIDKNKEPNEIFLDIASGVKMAELVKVIKEQEVEINRLTYKKSIKGSLITNLVNEAKDQIMQISGMANAIQMDTNNYEVEVNSIKSALEKMQNLYEALNFESIERINGLQFKNICEILMKPDAILNNAMIEIHCDDENEVLTQNIENAVYLVIKIVQLLLNEQIKKIIVSINIKENKVGCKVEAKDKQKLDEIDFKELNVISESIKVIRKENLVEISM